MGSAWLFMPLRSRSGGCRSAGDLAVFEFVANCFQLSMALGWREPGQMVRTEALL